MPEAAKPAAMLGVIERLEKVRGIGRGGSPMGAKIVAFWGI